MWSTTYWVVFAVKSSHPCVNKKSNVRHRNTIGQQGCNVTIIDNIEARNTEIIFKLPTLKHFAAHAELRHARVYRRG